MTEAIHGPRAGIVIVEKEGLVGSIEDLSEIVQCHISKIGVRVAELREKVSHIVGGRIGGDRGGCHDAEDEI